VDAFHDRGGFYRSARRNDLAAQPNPSSKRPRPRRARRTATHDPTGTPGLSPEIPARSHPAGGRLPAPDRPARPARQLCRRSMEGAWLWRPIRPLRQNRTARHHRYLGQHESFSTRSE